MRSFFFFFFFFFFFCNFFFSLLKEHSDQSCETKKNQTKPKKKSWPNLHKMKASFNSISGEIPAWLGSMKKLSYIKIRNNKLSGAIPQELAASPALFFLDAADNGLGGAVPQFGEKLGVLDVSGNGKLTGPIDKALGSAVGLQVVGLKNNPGLCGPVPSSARWAVGFSAEGTGLGKPCGASSSSPFSSSTPEKKET